MTVLLVLGLLIGPTRTCMGCNLGLTSDTVAGRKALEGAEGDRGAWAPDLEFDLALAFCLELGLKLGLGHGLQLVFWLGFGL